MNESGCTVHFVDNTLDGGPIIAQRTVPVLAADTVEILSARILEQEHILYPERLRGSTRTPREMTIDEQLSYLSKGTTEIIRTEELRVKLQRSATSGKPLRVKLGADPTAPDIHLGHTVVIRKLRAFQELGHIAIFLIGDFTGMIGDPSGKNTTRTATHARRDRRQRRNLQTTDLQTARSGKTVIEFNSRWMNDMGSAGFLRLSSHVTVRQILERDDFQQRLEANRPLALHEVMYPLVMAYDSVALEADVELGGTDQKFNLLMGQPATRVRAGVASGGDHAAAGRH